MQEILRSGSRMRGREEGRERAARDGDSPSSVDLREMKEKNQVSPLYIYED